MHTYRNMPSVALSVKVDLWKEKFANATLSNKL